MQLLRKLAECDNNPIPVPKQTPALYADIDGVLMPVTKSSEGEKYQVSEATMV